MHYRYFTQAKGYLAQSERWQLYLLANQLPPNATIVNIGVEHGASVACLRQGNRTATIVGVDLDNTKYEQPFGPDQVILTTGDSARVGQLWNDKNVDLLFIDGDHTYEGCKADIDSWLPHMAEGAIIAFHDSQTAQCEGVTRAIGEWYSKAVNWVELPKAGTIRTFKHVLPLAVLIPTYKRAPIVQRTVDLILSNLRHLGQIDVFVGDDSNDGETQARLQGYPATHFINTGGRGLGANLNQLLGISNQMGHELIFQMDDDHHLIAPLDLSAHVDKLMREQNAGWIQCMINAGGNEHWDVSDFSLRGDDLRHWRIMPDSPCKFIASNQPHLKHRRVHDFYGLYAEGGKTWHQETEFNERVQDMHKANPNSPRFYMPTEAYGFKYWRHVGDSYVQRGM